MNYKTGHRAAMVLLFGGVGLGFLAAMMDTHWLELVGVVLALAGIAADAVFYRCPCCRKSLAGHGRQPQHCPHCGAQLDDDRDE